MNGLADTDCAFNRTPARSTADVDAEGLMHMFLHSFQTTQSYVHSEFFRQSSWDILHID